MLFKNKKSTDTFELENNNQDTTSTTIKTQVVEII